LGEFEGKNKDDSNTSSPSPQSVENKKDCRDKCALQSIFGGRLGIRTPGGFHLNGFQVSDHFI